MNIVNFNQSRLRIGSEYPTTLDVVDFQCHESNGFAVSVTAHRMDGDKNFFQLRRINDQLSTHFLCLFSNEDPGRLPDHLRGSEVVYDSRFQKVEQL